MANKETRNYLFGTHTTATFVIDMSKRVTAIIEKENNHR